MLHLYQVLQIKKGGVMDAYVRHSRHFSEPAEKAREVAIKVTFSSFMALPLVFREFQLGFPATILHLFFTS